MKSDIRKYLSLRDSLIQERTQLESRLREITEALGETGATAPSISRSASTPAAAPARVGRRGRGGRRGGGDGLSLREAVLQITSGGPRTKEEILEGVQRLGYRFSTNNPLNSLGVILYGKNPKFKNDGGRFSPAGSGGGGGGRQQASPSAPRSGGKRRTMSPEARERIAAAQRARWAKAKGGK